MNSRSSSMSTFLIIVFVLFASKCFGQINFNVNFESASSVLSSSQKHTILMRIDSIKLDQRKYRFSLIGHTDNVGGKQYNDTLSHQRALSVYKFLKENSIETANIFIDSKGYGDPLSSNLSEQGKSDNRRVELDIQTWDEFLLSEIKEKIPLINLSFENENGYDYSEYPISICQNAFSDADGELIIGEIEIRYQEYRTFAEFMGLNKSLQFMRNDELFYFQSGGMYLIEAFHKGERVFLNKNCLLVDYRPNNELPYDKYIFENNSSWVDVEEKNATEVKADDKSISVDKNADSDNENEEDDELEKSPSLCEITCSAWIAHLCDLYERSVSDEIAFSHTLSLDERFRDLNYQGGLHYSELRSLVQKEMFFVVSTVELKKTKKYVFFKAVVDDKPNNVLIPVLKYVYRVKRKHFEEYMKGKPFSNYRISRNENTGRFNMTFKDSTTMVTLESTAFDFERLIFKKRSRKKHKGILQMYTTLLSASDSLFSNERRSGDSISCIWTSIEPEFLGAEGQLAIKDWTEYFELNKLEYKELLKPFYENRHTYCQGISSDDGYQVDSIVKRLANDLELGLFNYDIEHKFNKTKHLKSVQFVDTESVELEIKKAFLCSKKNNALISVDPSDFWIDNSTVNCLILFDQFGKLYKVVNSSINLNKIQADLIGDKSMELIDINEHIEMALSD